MRRRLLCIRAGGSPCLALAGLRAAGGDAGAASSAAAAANMNGDADDARDWGRGCCARQRDGSAGAVARFVATADMTCSVLIQ